MIKDRYKDTDLYIVESELKNVRLLQSKLAKLSTFACNEGAIKSITNCSFYTTSYVLGRDQGDERNNTYGDSDNGKLCDVVIKKDGTYKYGKFNNWDYVNDVVCGFSAGAFLIANGQDCDMFSEALNVESIIKSKHPRTAFAILKNGKCLQFVSEGRTGEDGGLTGYEVRDYLKSKYDIELLAILDGGKSTELIVDKKIVNQMPSGEQKMLNGIAFIEPKAKTLKYIDISNYQKEVDYQKVKDKYDGVILRCGVTTYGDMVCNKDKSFEKHYEGFKKVGMPLGVYYYSCANTISFAQKEAKFALETLKGKQFELPVYYDIENNQKQSGLSYDLLTSIVKEFVRILIDNNYYAGVYASVSWLRDKFNAEGIETWVAQYNSVCTYTKPYGMWQYSSSGKVDGISGNVDMDYCYKDFSFIKEKGMNGFDIKEAPQEKPTDDYNKLLIDYRELETEYHSLEVKYNDKVKENEALNDRNIELEKALDDSLLTLKNIRDLLSEVDK